jgi:hypothetical protein
MHIIIVGVIIDLVALLTYDQSEAVHLELLSDHISTTVHNLNR